MTLGNIDSVRAASHTDPSSPTGAVVRDRTGDLADIQRMTQVGNIRAQTAEDLASAAYLRSAGEFAMTQGMLGAGADVFSGLGQTKWNQFGLA